MINLKAFRASNSAFFYVKILKMTP